MSRRTLIIVLVVVLLILVIIAIYYFGFYLPRHRGEGIAGSPPPSAPSRGAPSSPTSGAPPGGAGAVAAPLTLCSFNIKWLGHYKNKAHEELALLLRDCDAVVVQELVATPVARAFPDRAVEADEEAKEFFDEMAKAGFRFQLSEEDTGPTEKIHSNGTGTEWWVAFYNPAKLTPAPDLPGGFLASDRANNPEYDRVPYAFPFRDASGTLDFVLISVHLHPDEGGRERRKGELAAIAAWIDRHDEGEKDFIILGDMNIQSCAELAGVIPQGFVSLNSACRGTNTKGDRPFDHVMLRPAYTTEADRQFGLEVVNLCERLPGPPCGTADYSAQFSDHHPVVFRLNPLAEDDD